MITLGLKLNVWMLYGSTGAQKGSGDGWWVSRASSDGATGHVVLRIHPYGAPGAAGTGREGLRGRY